ncbi:MAG: transposase [Nitrospirae bacterium]|nr:transposase [Nitrospirota bacterium]
MARQLRIEFEGAFYHVTSRGNMRDRIFFHDEDRERFPDILGKTKERYCYLLHAYALMDNHYHLLVETPKANISQVMQNVNTSYTVYANRKYRRSGHLFQGRFKGMIVDKNEYLVTLSRYIHLNPVRAGIVEKPEDSEWTSYKTYVGGAESGRLVDKTDTLGVFSEKKRKAIEKYRAFVEAGIEGMESPFKEAEAGLILGRGSFKEKIREILRSLKRDDDLPQIGIERIKSIDAVVNVCGEYFKVEREELIRRRRRLPARQATIYLSKVLSGKTDKAIGEYFCIKGMAVSKVIKATEEKSASDKVLRKQIGELKERILSVT